MFVDSEGIEGKHVDKCQSYIGRLAIAHEFERDCHSPAIHKALKALEYFGGDGGSSRSDGEA